MYLDLLKNKINNANSIVITTHDYPDADGIGSQISLCLALRHLNKKVLCVNEEPLLERYKYLDPKDVVIGHDEFVASKEEFDLLIVVDTNTNTRIGKKMAKLAQNKEVLYIDHHPCPHREEDKHIVDTEKAATGQLVGELIQDMGIKFTKEMALPLYTAIIIDTSSFRYPNVTASTHKIVSDLMATGIYPPEAYNGIYGTKKIQHMHILGSILKSTDCNERGDVAWLILDMEEISKQGTDVEDTHAFINNLLVLDDIKVACMFRDDGDAVKISFRSTGNIDVGYVARALGGGGHSHSAATILMKDGKTTQEIIKESVVKIEKAIDDLA